MTKPLLWLILGFFLAHLSAYAGGDPLPLGGRAWGLANASVSLKDGWALWNNAGALGNLKERQCLAAYDLRYGLKSLQTMAFGYVHPMQKGTAGISVGRMGDELYSENTLGLSYGYAWEKISFGGKVNYIQTSLAEIGTRRTVSIDMGVMAQLLPQLTLGAHIYNLTQSKFDKTTNERLPTIMKAGLAYQASQKVLLLVETEKDIDFPAAFKTGLEYEIVKNLRLRTGISTHPQVYAFGIGFSPKKFQLDYAIRTHPILGMSHHLSVQISIPKKKVKSLEIANPE